MAINEIWVSVPGFSLYEVSNTGQIRSTDYKRTKKVIVLKPAVSTDGYLKTMLLKDDGTYSTIAVHRIVLSSFSTKPSGHEVNHKNGIKTDNRLENLEWVTRGGNIKHAYSMGFLTPKRGALNGNSKLNADQVREIRQYAREHGPRYGRKQLAEKYGVSDSYIKEIVSRRRNGWRDV